MHRKSVAWLGALALALAGCAPKETPELTAAQVDSIRAMATAFTNAFNAKDMDAIHSAIMTQYAEDAAFAPPGAPLIHGRDAIRQWMDTAMAQMESVNLTLTPAHTWGRGDLAYEVGTTSMSMTMGGQTMSEEGKYITVFRRGADGQWRIAADTWNSNTPPAPPAPPAPPPAPAGRRR